MASRPSAIVLARSPHERNRGRGMVDQRVLDKAESEAFVRGWWGGARNLTPALASPAYRDGYAAGTDWRMFHGSERQPHATHALDAYAGYLETTPLDHGTQANTEGERT